MAIWTVALVCAAGSAGCQWVGGRGHWCDCQSPAPHFVHALHERSRQCLAEDCGIRQLAAAVEAGNTDRARAAGLYYSAAIASASCLARSSADDPSGHVARGVHQAGLKGLLATAAMNQSGSPTDGLFVAVDAHTERIPVSLHGFAWDAADVQRLYVVEGYQTDALSRVHRRPGFGVPVVLQRVQRTGSHGQEQFLPERSTFAATAVLRLAGHAGAADPNNSRATIELYNPNAIDSVEIGGGRIPLAADLSAPLAYHAIHESPRVNPIAWFLDPDAAGGSEGLYFLEPYQPGKIPVVFVHGLLSSPSTWIDMINDLRATPGFDDHFQIWAFRYATGRSFLRAAAQLRRALYEATKTVDPCGDDAALRSIVLVGHSMGGLVSKLQVVESRDVLWNSIAARPFEQIVADGATRQELAEVLFFEPHPNVRRAVFLAVPHGGSSWAARPVGRLASAVVQIDDERSEQHARLIADNPGVFAPEVERRLPTSIDMLEPSHPLLQAIGRLPLATCVRGDSVIGAGGLFTRIAPTDGIVPVHSARHRQVESETFVDADHEHVHRSVETVQQMHSILRRHLAEYAAQPSER
jgi:pimeloyl-ACP methyl ester carboxylesterase